MAEWTKADYTAAYSVCPRGVYQYPDGHSEPRRFVEVRLHYHPAVMLDIVEKRLDNILAKYPLVATDAVLVFGSGFGWLCEAISNRIGCPTLGIDTSTYILDNKDVSPNDELLESIIAAGLNTTEDPGKQIWESFSQTAPRSTANVQNLDVRINKERNDVRRILGTPTHVITEEVWQLLTDQERIDYQAAFDNLGVITIHVIDGIVL